MPRLPIAANIDKPNPYALAVPLWYRLDIISQSNLKHAQWKNHRKRLNPPELTTGQKVTKCLKPETGEEIEKIMRNNQDVSR